MRHLKMADINARPLVLSETVSVWNVVCGGACRHQSDEECAVSTHMVFPYRGMYLHHIGRAETVAEANQVVFINEDEPYRVSHPIEGGDSTVSIGLSAPTLLELMPAEYRDPKGRAAFNRTRLRVDSHAQAGAAALRHRLHRGKIEKLEAEVLTLTLLRHVLGERTSFGAVDSVRRQKLVDNAKLVMSSDLGRRWALADVAAEVGVSPVYLTQVFQRVEGVPLYRYQLQLRLARALDLLGEYDDLTTLAFDLGFSSHSHFSAAFKQAYGQTPLGFQRSARIR